MAAISKHGQNEIIEYVSFKKAYCSDGKILKNYGSGWKLYGKIKSGYDYKSAYAEAKKNQDKKLKEFPAYAKFFKAIKSLCRSMQKRQLLIQGLSVSSNDPDGLWSDLDGYWQTKGAFTFGDIEKICNAYDKAITEQNKK